MPDDSGRTLNLVSACCHPLKTFVGVGVSNTEVHSFGFIHYSVDVCSSCYVSFSSSINDLSSVYQHRVRSFMYEEDDI